MNIQKMMKQAQEMQRKLAEAQANIEATEKEGASGGGAVKLTLNGKGQLLKLSIDASVINADDKEMLEDLIIAAHNDAKGQIDEAAASGMSSVTGGLNLPAGLKLPF